DYLDVRLEPDAWDRLELFRLADEQQTTGHLVVVQRFGADVVTRRPNASSVANDGGEHAAQPVEPFRSTGADRFEHDVRGRGAPFLLPHLVERANHHGCPPAVLADRTLARQTLVRGEAEDALAGPGEMELGPTVGHGCEHARHEVRGRSVSDVTSERGHGRSSHQSDLRE